MGRVIVLLAFVLVGLADGRRGKPRGKADMFYYDLLGVPREASDRDIRRAFKKLAIKHHPDKHPNDPGAHDNFLQYTRAYEIMKDPEVRKKYDKLGKEGLEEDEKNGGGGGGRGGGFHDSRFYEREFGLYDEDEQIDTMTSRDFWPMFEGEEVYFVNFYSTGCSHCHDLAPTWRELGTALDGVIGIGAVNCQESWDVCRNMRVHSYPTLMLMKGNQQYDKYTGARSLRALQDFVMQRFPLPPIVTLHVLPPPRSVVMVCVPEVYECEEQMEHRKLAASLSGIVGVYTLDCSQERSRCNDWGVGEQPQAVWVAPDGKIVQFYPPLDGDGEEQGWGDVYSTHSLTEATLKMLPLPPAVDAETFAKMVDTPRGGKISDEFLGNTAEQTWISIESGKACEVNNEGIQRYKFYESVGNVFSCKSLCEQDLACNAIDFYTNTRWCNLYTMPCATPARVDRNAESIALRRGSGIRGVLVYFVDLTKTDENPKIADLEREIRQMPHQQLGRIGVEQRVVHCDQMPQLCAQVRADMPEVRLYKEAGHENYHGESKAKLLLKWVHDSLTTNVIALSADDVEEIMQMDPTSSDGTSWFIDYYASWCPPCKEMLPHYRQASMMTDSTVRFGSIDCNKHDAFCKKQGVTGYPSPAFYTASKRADAQWYDGDWNNPDEYLEHINDVFNPPTTQITEHSWHNEWQEELHAKKEVWLVLVTAYGNWCGPCQNMNKMMKQVAKEDSSGLYRVGIINCDEDRKLCDYLDVTGYPQLRRYQSTPDNDGTNGALSGFIWNGHSFPQSIINWAYEALPDEVEEMNRESFLSTVVRSPAAWLVTYSCPRWCRPCANWRPQQKTLAYLLRNHNVRIAHVDCDDNKPFCTQQGVRAYPKAMLYMPGGDDVRHLDISSVDQMAEYLRQVATGIKNAVEGGLDDEEFEGSFDHDEF